MRRIIWSPKSQQDYSELIDYLLQNWTLKEVQQFVDKVENIVFILRKGNVEFKKTANRKLHVAVISEQISIYYRIHSSNRVEIVRLWDNRQKPSALLSKK
ncbi:MAG TPA: type II toxin-antitoxin system RelE/ParE family toxin [Prolixibacteraceae bacterium]|nr:type II toxin-antitoxin system RelE/ParE family toxin [Prolixibacteraceae bacterium]HPR60903.1 type II toxin-antitoxin system RelE/ParE family toxin [Prolixibacteraceae bacterium]